MVRHDLPEERPWPYPELIEQRMDWAIKNYYHNMENMAWLDDDNIPYLAPYTGTEIFAEAFGAKVHCPGDNMPFALPAIYNVEEIGKLKQPKVENSSLYILFEMARKLIQRAGGNPLLMMPDIQSPVDIAALVMEKSQFLIAMVDEPSAIKQLVAMTEELLTEFLDLWFSEFGTKYIAHCPWYYMEGGFTFSEDEVGAFDARFFEEFCLEPINRMSDRFGGCSMHCCANARHQWDNFKKIHGLRLLNLVQPKPVLEEAGRFFGAEVCHWHSFIQYDGDALGYSQWALGYPPQVHVVLEAPADTKEKAIEYCHKLREIGERRKKACI